MRGSDELPLRCLILGLDGAGKSTLLYRAKLGEVVNACGTIGFNFESIDVGVGAIDCWDIGGQDKVRGYYRG